MKPIKKGMTEAVTRDGRKVTQLKWFENSGDYSCAGVMDGQVYVWTSSGNYLVGHKNDPRDIFAHVEYEWQWLIKNDDGTFKTSSFYKSEEDLKNFGGIVPVNGWQVISRIEESKREVE